jgi:hypothetical protein
MCYEQHNIYTCYCEYKVWHKCSTALSHEASEKAANDKAVAEGRPQDVKTTGSPCSKTLKEDVQQWNWICQPCREGRDPREPGEPGEGKVMPGKLGRRVREEWDGTHGTPENHA